MALRVLEYTAPLDGDLLCGGRAGGAADRAVQRRRAVASGDREARPDRRAASAGGGHRGRSRSTALDGGGRGDCALQHGQRTAAGSRQRPLTCLPRPLGVRIELPRSLFDDAELGADRGALEKARRQVARRLEPIASPMPASAVAAKWRTPEGRRALAFVCRHNTLRHYAIEVERGCCMASGVARGGTPIIQRNITVIAGRISDLPKD